MPSLVPLKNMYASKKEENANNDPITETDLTISLPVHGSRYHRQIGMERLRDQEPKIEKPNMFVYDIR